MDDSTVETVAEKTILPLPVIHHQIGLAASMIYGAGFNYQYLFLPEYRVSVTGIPVWSKSSDEYYLYISAGLSFQRDLLIAAYDARNNIYRMYLFMGGAYWKKVTEYEDDPYDDNTRSRSATFGGGIGLEILLVGQLSGFFDIGYHYEHHFNSSKRHLGFAASIGAGLAF